MNQAPAPAPRSDRFIYKVGCLLVAIPVGAFIVVTTAESLNIPPGGILFGVLIVALVAGGFGSGGRSSQSPPGSSQSVPGARRVGPPRRNPYETMREIVDRYESGEISAERRDELVRELRR